MNPPEPMPATAATDEAQRPPAEVVHFLEECGLPPAVWARVERLACYFRDLAEANAQTNLTRLTSAPDFWVKHVADSLAIGRVCPALLTGTLRAADVGSGAGFPLIPLAWANPALDITGIESNSKKVAFLEAEIARLQLGNCRILSRQAREAGRLPEHQGAYEVVVARAVASPSALVRECRQLLGPGPDARLIIYSTPAACAAEHAMLTREAAKFKFRVELSEPLLLPLDAGARQFVLFSR